MDWRAVVWFLGALIPLLLLERWIHRHLQGAALLLVDDVEVAAHLYALPLLPGVALHEASHALAARLVGARVGRISILPARKGGRIQLGFVPVEKTGSLRTAFIGLAPLVVGCLALLLIGWWGLGLGPVGSALAVGDWETAWTQGVQVVDAPNVWIWVYIAFAISNTMLPSRSDMRAWPTLLLFAAGTILLVALLGLGSALAAPLAGMLRWLAIICALTLLIDLPFALLIMGVERVLERVRGTRIEYH